MGPRPQQDIKRACDLTMSTSHARCAQPVVPHIAARHFYRYTGQSKRKPCMLQVCT